MVKSMGTLKQISAFQPLSPLTLERLSKHTTTTEFAENIILSQQKETLSCLCVVVSDFVKTYCQSKDRIHFLAVLRDKDFLVSECLSDNKLSSSFAETMTTATLIHIPSGAIQHLLEFNLIFRIIVLQSVTARLILMDLLIRFGTYLAKRSQEA